MQELFAAFLGKFSYIGLFGILLAAGLGVPLPEDIPLVTAGWLVHKGQAELIPMMLTGLVGVMAGDCLMFRMGRKYGSHLIEHKWLRRIAKPWLLEKARQKYADHGAKILFAARFMPGLRAAMFLSAGVFGVPFWKFFLIDGIAALISVPVWVWAGWKFSSHMEAILGGARTATYVAVGLIVIALIVWGIYEWRHNLRRRDGMNESVVEQPRSAPSPGLQERAAVQDRRPVAPLSPAKRSEKGGIA